MVFYIIDCVIFSIFPAFFAFLQSMVQWNALSSRLTLTEVLVGSSSLIRAFLAFLAEVVGLLWHVCVV